jgi:glycerophosphoryl diester phosphodiesterase
MHTRAACLFLATLAGCQGAGLDRAVVAHRGASYYAPEATAAAYRLAGALGADFLELDLQRTKDGKLIALHDDTLKRTTNVEHVFPTRVDQPVSSFTLAELRRLNAGEWFNKNFPDRGRASFADLKILTLEEIVEIARESPHKPGLYIETKVPEKFPGIEKDLAAELKRLGWYGAGTPDQPLLLQTFQPESLAMLRTHFPRAPLVWLMWFEPKDISKLERGDVEKYLQPAIDLGAVGVGVNRESLANPTVVDVIRASGMYLHPYTVDDAEEFGKLEKLGADGFFTNRPDRLLGHYGRACPSPSETLRKLGYD